MPNPLFETPLKELEIAVFDLETTGLFPSADRIIQIATVHVSGGGVTGVDREWKVNPGESHLPLENVIVELTRITTEELREAPDIVDVLSQFRNTTGRRVVAGHNVAGFDLPFIRRAERISGIDVQSDYYIDTLVVARLLKPDLRRHRLKDCADAWGIEYDEEELHDALVDTRLCAKLLNAQIEDLFNLDHRVETFYDFLRWVRR